MCVCAKRALRMIGNCNDITSRDRSRRERRMVPEKSGLSGRQSNCIPRPHRKVFPANLRYEASLIGVCSAKYSPFETAAWPSDSAIYRPARLRIRPFLTVALSLSSSLTFVSIIDYRERMRKKMRDACKSLYGYSTERSIVLKCYRQLET